MVSKRNPELDDLVRRTIRADRLRGLRERKGLTQRDLAEVIDVAPLSVVRWEGGLAFPQVRSLRKLAELYDVSIVYLRTGQNEVHDPHRRNSG